MEFGRNPQVETRRPRHGERERHTQGDSQQVSWGGHSLVKSDQEKGPQVSQGGATWPAL